MWFAMGMDTDEPVPPVARHNRHGNGEPPVWSGFVMASPTMPRLVRTSKLVKRVEDPVSSQLRCDTDDLVSCCDSLILPAPTASRFASLPVRPNPVGTSCFCHHRGVEDLNPDETSLQLRSPNKRGVWTSRAAPRTCLVLQPRASTGTDTRSKDSAAQAGQKVVSL